MRLSFQNALQEIKNRVDILSVISKHLTVKKNGSNYYVAVCPFHADKAPSLYITPSKGIFKCFACGAKGDVFRFLMDYQKIDLSEAVHQLAEQYGIEIIKREISAELSEEQNFIFRLNDLAAQFFEDQLKGEARNYLINQRQLNEDTVKSFTLGYSLENRDSLLQFIKQELNPPIELLEKSGLFIQDPNTRVISDRFRGRLMIPIKDGQSRTIAFGARTLNSNIQPKYLNSPETPVYHKSYHLFGWNIAQNFTKQKKQVLLLEGYFDVIQAHQQGLLYAVGSLGTALTKEQASILYGSNLARKIILGFDNDNAGLRALIASIKIFQERRFNQKPDLRALSLEDSKDLDEYLLKHNKAEETQALIENSPKAYEFLLQTKTKDADLQNTETRKQILKELTELLKGETDPIEKEIWAEACARTLSFSKNTVLNLIIDKPMPLVQEPRNNFERIKNKNNKTFQKNLPKKPSNKPEKSLIVILALSEESELLEKIARINLADASLEDLKQKLFKMPLAEKKAFLEQNPDFHLSLTDYRNQNFDKAELIDKLAQEINLKQTTYKTSRRIWKRPPKLT